MLLSSCAIPVNVNHNGIVLPISSRTLRSVYHEFLMGYNELFEIYRLDESTAADVVQAIHGNKNWQPLPMAGSVSGTVYGLNKEVSELVQVGEKEDMVMPVLDSGYYSIYDTGNKSYYIMDHIGYDYLTEGYCLSVFDTNTLTFYYFKTTTPKSPQD